jgi:hypothetical protein
MAHFKITVLALLALFTSLACEQAREFPQDQDMTTAYVPVPAPLPGTITLPQDVVDDVVVGTVNPPMQDLANDGAWQGRIRGTVFQALVDYPGASPYAAAVGLNLLPSGSIQQNITLVGPANKRIAFTYAGLYLIQFQVTGFSTDAPPFSYPYQMGIFKVGSTTPVALADFPGVATESICFRGAALAQIAAGEEYELRTSASGGYAFSVSSPGLSPNPSSRVTITRIQ